MKPSPRQLLSGVALAGTALWSAILAQSHLSARATVLDRLESSLLDMRVSGFGPQRAPETVIIAAIDDDTVRWAKSFPIPRQLLAEAVSRLHAAGVKAVAIDELFLDPAVTAADDEALAQSLRGGRTAIAAMVEFPPDRDGSAAPPTCRRPVQTFREAAGLGAVNIAPDRSGIVRHIPMVLPCDKSVLPALSLQAALLAAADNPVFEADAVSVGSARTPLDVGRHLALRYYGPEGTFKTVSLGAIARGETGADLLRGKTVVVGATAHGVGDRYPTPFETTLPGVEIMATGIANLETGKALTRTTTTRTIDAGVTVILALTTVGCFLLDNIGQGFAILTIVVALWIAAVLAGFAQGIWFAMAIPLGATVPAGALTALGRLALDRWTERNLRRQHGILAGFQSPAMLARLKEDPEFLSKPVERDIATVFIDISGFTGLSERLGPRSARDLLKAWHEVVEDLAAAGGGSVASYMADGAMLVWGLAEPRPDDALRAVRTAIALERETLLWLKSVEPQTGPLSVKIGGHVGPAVLSRLGHSTHQHITAIGDTVNVASRLMKVAADRNFIVAVSAALLARAQEEGLGKNEASFTTPEEVIIRGRQHTVPVCFASQADV